MRLPPSFLIARAGRLVAGFLNPKADRAFWIGKPEQIEQQADES